MQKCNSSYAVGDFADLNCILDKGHVSALHDTGVIVWFNYCEHEMASNYPDGKHAYCNKCYASVDNL